MENDRRFYRVRSLQQVGTALSCGLQSALWFLLAYQHYQSWAKGWSGVGTFGFSLAAAVIMLIVALLSVRQNFRPAYTLELDEDSVKLRRRRLAASEIKRIYVSEDDNPSVSVKPRRSAFVPNDYSFRFSDNSAQSVKEIIRWANANGISLAKRRSSKLYE